MRAHIFVVALCGLFSAGGSFAQTYESKQADALVAAAMERTQHLVLYDGRYRSIAYPDGDVPNNIGVCTDLVVRAYRQLGIDLQQLVHEDMVKSFNAYPKNWGLKKPDTNIDHRRVPNLATFFRRHSIVLPTSDDAKDYQPGDIVTWRLTSNVPHIGIVTDSRSSKTGNPIIAHNIGFGPKLDDMLFDYVITGHFRYFGDTAED